MNEKTFRARVQHKHKTEAQWVLDVYTDATQTTLREDPFIPLSGELIIFDKDENNEFDRIKVGDGINNVMALPFATSSELQAFDLPQKWYDINQAYENFGEPGHKLLGGLIYKDFDGNIQVYPLSPAYGVRTEECGEKLPSVVVYNSAQQILCKGPTIDNRHVVNLHYLNEIFGGGTVDVSSTKEFSIQKIPPVDMTPPIGERRPYVFCRDSENKFAGKVYSELIWGDVLVERNENGDILVNDPTASRHPVSLNYFQNQFSELFAGKSWVPNYENVWQFRSQEEFNKNSSLIGGTRRTFEWDTSNGSAVYRATSTNNWIQRYVPSGFADGTEYKYVKVRYMLPQDAPQNLLFGLVQQTTTNSQSNASFVQDGVHTFNGKSVYLINDGKWHDLVYNLYASSTWDSGTISLIRWATSTAFTNPIYVQQFGLFRSYEEAINSEPLPKIATQEWVLKNVEEMLLNGTW